MNQTALLVSADKKATIKNLHNLEKYLLESTYSLHECSLIPAKIQQSILILNPDIVVIYCEKATADLLHIIKTIQDKTPKTLIIFTDHSNDKMIADSIIAGASAFVVDGIEAQRIRPIIDIAMTRFIKCQRQHSNKTSLKHDERRNIDHAKGMLMKTKGMSEDKAYQFLRKMAMDKNQRISKISQSLLKTIEPHQKCA